jgi:hypothetical protein
MTSDKTEPPRGEAAWQAAKARVAERNEAAYARGREKRTEHDAAVRRRRVAAERRELASLPEQPRQA